MNRIDLIKALLPGFLPILVYILADALFGEQIGLLTAILFGLVELAYGYIKEKRIDPFIILDVGLIVALGGVSILLDTPLFFKMKPAIIEFLLSAILLYSLYSPNDIIGGMLSRYSRNTLSVPSGQQMRRMLLPLIVILAGHALLTLAAAFWMSKEMWAFVSGGLFYIVFALFFLAQILKRKIQRQAWIRKYGDDEWFDVIDESGRILFRAPRSVCHGDPSLLHAVVHLHVFDGSMRLYLQKRPADKLVQPGKWDTAVGGHVNSGESIGDALKREALEELNLNLESLKLVALARYIWRNELESEMVFSFYCQVQKAIVPNAHEIEEGRFWTARQIREKLNKGLLSENFEYEFDAFLQGVFDGTTPHRLHTR